MRARVLALLTAAGVGLLSRSLEAARMMFRVVMSSFDVANAENRQLRALYGPHFHHIINYLADDLMEKDPLGYVAWKRPRRSPLGPIENWYISDSRAILLSAYDCNSASDLKRAIVRRLQREAEGLRRTVEHIEAEGWHLRDPRFGHGLRIRPEDYDLIAAELWTMWHPADKGPRSK